MTEGGRRLVQALGLHSTSDVIRAMGDRVVAWSRTTDTICVERRERSIYVKRYRYPRWRHRLRGMFRGTLLGKHRARREFRALERLRSIGVPVVRPLGWGERRIAGFVTVSYLITEGIAGAMSLSRYATEHLLSRDDASVRVARTQVVRDLAQAVRRMHRGGLLHGNLFLRNILIRPGFDGRHEFFFLDAVRVRRANANGPHQPGVIADLAGLASVGNEVCRRAEVMLFAKEYLGVSHLTDRERNWIRQVVAAGQRRRDHELYRLRVERYFGGGDAEATLLRSTA